MSKQIDGPKRLARKVIYENPWVNLYVDRVQLPDGRIINEQHMLDFDMDAVAVLITNQQGYVLMIQSYRYPTQTVEWEIPAGVVDEGESVLETAQREALEETGYEVTTPEPVYTYYPFVGMANKVYHITRCRVLEKVADFDHNEVRSLRWVSRAEIRQMISGGIIRDGFTLTALLLNDLDMVGQQPLL